MITTLKQLMKEIRSRKSKVSDRELFLSSAYNAFLMKMQAGILKGQIPVKVYMKELSPEHSAMTDSHAVVINYNNPTVQNLTRNKRHLVYLGLALHEYAHILFTDFHLIALRINELRKGNIYPAPSSNRFYNDTEDMLRNSSKNRKEELVELYNRLDNVIEDAFIERAIKVLSPGYSECIVFTRNLSVKYSPSDISYYQDKEDLVTFFMLVFTYSIYGMKYKNTSVQRPSVTDLLDEVYPIIDKALSSAAPSKRALYVNEIFCYLCSYIAKEIPDNTQSSSAASNENDSSSCGNTNNVSNSDECDSDDLSGDEDHEDYCDENENSSNQSSSNSEDDTDNASNEFDSDTTSCENNQATANINDSEDMNDNADDSKSDEKNDMQNDNQQSSEVESGETTEENTSSEKAKGSDSENSSSASEDGKNEEESRTNDLANALDEISKNVGSSEQCEHDLNTKPSAEAIDTLQNAFDSSTDEETNQNVEPSNELEDKNLDTVLESIATEEIEKEQENEIQRELNADLKEIDKEPFHKNVSAIVKRVQYTETHERIYDSVHEELDTIVRRFMKEFEKELEEQALGDLDTGLYNGTMVDCEHVYRNDRRIMAKKQLPGETPRLGIGILLDISGSTSGTKIQMEKKCAYITWRFCKKLSIPVFVIGHNSNGTVHLYSVADEHSIDNKDGARIFALNSDSCNRDGYALRYCINKLKKMDADEKLMMIISDGSPNDRGYGFREGQADCQAAVMEALKENITTITAGLGCDAMKIKEMYQANISSSKAATFLDITNLEKMPKAFIKIIKERLSETA